MRHRTDASSLAAVPGADGPAPAHADKLNLYGQFVGDWETDVFAYPPDGSRHQGRGEIHFDWILEGRAIQDVWLIPRRAERRADAPVLPLAGNWYGTTIRAYDPVQQGTTDTGTLSRWTFTEITPRSFHWKAEASLDQGASWRLFVAVFARRTRS